MKKLYIYISISILLLAFSSCGNKAGTVEKQTAENRPDTTKEEVTLSAIQMKKLGVVVDSLQKHLFSDQIETNGELSVLPQDQAAVSTPIGANISSICVYEGQKVQKGQTLAFLSHPDLLNLQTRYIDACSQLEYTEKEYSRQKDLFNQNAGSGRDYQKIRSDYYSLRGDVRNLEAQLAMLHLRPAVIRRGKLYRNVPLKSPINGYVDRVNAKTGQFVDPQATIFAIINNHHIFADMMVYEKDVTKLRIGQEVLLSIQSLPKQVITAKIFSVGKTFEPNPKAVHVHALIDNKYNLISGMYVKGKIITGRKFVFSLPDEGIIEEDGKQYIFVGRGNKFRPVEVTTGRQENGWTEITLSSPLSSGELVAQNDAYYLMSEMKKDETGEE
ncbi:MAG: efflux RND transporter periplasmic adaptor subunit [Bacteroidaceae bacterium]|nr:efflux RND transporter periplasmic adaptor subunit [Bacteroidaceae bacterium]